jgi:hypothetical protein
MIIPDNLIPQNCSSGYHEKIVIIHSSINKCPGNNRESYFAHLIQGDDRLENLEESKIIERSRSRRFHELLTRQMILSEFGGSEDNLGEADRTRLNWLLVNSRLAAADLMAVLASSPEIQNCTKDLLRRFSEEMSSQKVFQR